LRARGTGLVAFARRQRAVGRQFLDAARIGGGAQRLGVGVGQRRLVLADGGFSRSPCLTCWKSCTATSTT
jgi:hypothetical protein